MNRHFLVPATIAAAIHAGLLFGIRPSHAEVPPSPVQMKPSDDGRMLIDVSPPPPETSAGSEAASPPVNPYPTRVEPPPTDKQPNFRMDVPPTPSGQPTVDQRIIPTMKPFSFSDPTGRPDGDGRGIFRSTDLDSTPRARVTVAPAYPFDAKRADLSGEVLVEFEVDESGAVQSPRVARSSNHVFDDAALRAVARWKFEPGRRVGKIVRFRMAVPIVFSLSNE